MFIRFTKTNLTPADSLIRSVLILIVLLACATVQPGLATGQDDAPLAIPSEFVRDLTVPGSMDHFLRPARIVYDPVASELYVADRGNNRIVVFNRQGTYRFEFAMADRVGSIVDFAVSPDGFVYVLASTREGRKLLQFDFDGLFLGELLSGPTGLEGMNVTSLAIDENREIHLLDESVPQLVRLTPEGEIRGRSPILLELDEKTRQELVFGSLSAERTGLLLPLSSQGTVYQFGFDGTHTATYGYKGATTGELNFPVSASICGDGLVLVLDKQRFNVLCFTPEGKFVGEFGGKGISPGWFYLPSYLAADDSDQVFISQVFLNRVQACRVPSSIQRRFQQSRSSESSPSLSSETGNTSPDNRFVSHPNYQPTEGGSQ